MKKYYKFFIILLIFSFIVPQIALASWWNPFSWNVWNRIFQVFSKPQTKITETLTPPADLIPIIQDDTPNKTPDSSEKIIQSQVQQQVQSSPVTQTVSTKTDQQKCEESYGSNSSYTGQKANNGDLICGCKTGYIFNAEETTCILIPANAVLCNGSYYYPCPTGETTICPNNGGKLYCQPQIAQTQPTQQQTAQTTPTAQLTQTIESLSQGVMSASQLYQAEHNEYVKCMAEVSELEKQAKEYEASHPILAECTQNMSSCIRGERAQLHNEATIGITSIYNSITSKTNICGLWVGGSYSKISDYTSSGINYQIYNNSGGSYKAYNQNNPSDTWTFYPQANGWSVYGNNNQHYEVYCSTGLCSVYGQ